jgi:beta-glucanase (GH16 family)
LVFEDNFNGATLDTTKWSRGYPWGRTHNHKAYMAPENVTVENGKLVITAEAKRHPDAPHSVNHDGYHVVDYTSGAINTSGKFNTTYGYLESRLKLTAAQGAWPAFWTLQGGWPPEIDIMENLNGTDTFYTNYHWGTWNNHQSFFRTHQGNNLTGAFRTYGLDWAQTHLRWYYQGNQIAQLTNQSAIAESAHHYLLLNLAVGGWPGWPNAADYPATYEADWVRVWKQVPAPERRAVAHWRLDETRVGPVADATGNSDGWTVSSPLLAQPGPAGQPHDYAYDFSGGIHGVNTGSATILPATDDFSLFVSFRTLGEHEAQGHLFSNNDAQPNRCNLHILNGYLHWWHVDNLRLVSPVRVDDGAWHEAGVTRQGNQWSLWLNGEVVATAEADVMIGQNRNWFIGRAHRFAFPLEGLVSDVRILNYARENGLIEHWTLDDTDLTFSNSLADLANSAPNGVLAQVHNANAPGSNPTTGLPGATPATATAIRLNTKFQRIETALTQNEHFGANPFTLAFWFRTDAKQDGVDILAASDNGPTPTPHGWTIELTGAAGSNQLGLGFFHRGWGGSGLSTSPNSLLVQSAVTVGHWHHLALVRSAAETDNLTLYLNGNPLWTRTNQQFFSVDPTKGVWFGRRPNFDATGTIGLFDDIRFYNLTLAPSDIASLATAWHTSTWRPMPTDGFAFTDPSAVPLRWLVDGANTSDQTFTIHFGEGADSLEPVATLSPGEPLSWSAGDLEYNRTYYWRVFAQADSGAIGGPVWSFSTKPFPIPGIVIDHSPKSTGRYVGSPSLVELPNGNYIASHDWFGPGTPFNQTVVFESTDRGRSWRQISSLPGQFWSNLFWHQDALYLIGTTARYGQSAIRRSGDGGHTWTTPVDEMSGILFPDSQYHTAPMPVVIHNGRIWRAMEDGQNGTQWGRRFRAFMMSAPVDADLLQAANWTASNRLAHNSAYLDGNFGGWLEGSAVVGPDGNILNILRVAYYAGHEKAAIIRISPAGKTATFDPANDFVDFRGGAKKFSIRHDPVSNRYWTLSNKVLPEHEGGNIERTRNAVALMSSADLRNWTTHSIVLYHPNVSHHGFQYLDWHFDGNDLIVVSRTAHADGMGGANSAHDANFMTFHRIESFRGDLKDRYQEWSRQYFDEESGGTGLDDDFNSDGLSNFFSYVFDLDPRQSSHRTPTGTRMVSNGEDSTPILVFRLRADVSILYDLETSEDLSFWTPHRFRFDGEQWLLEEGVSLKLTEVVRDADMVTLQLSPLPEESRFYRLRAMVSD